MAVKQSAIVTLYRPMGAAPTPAVAPELAPVGTIQELAKAAHSNGDTLTFDDGSNPATIFEYRVTAGAVTPGNIKIDASAATSAHDVGAITIAAILAAGMRISTATQDGSGLITVTSSLADEALPYVLAADAVGEDVVGMAAPTGAATWTYKIVGKDARGNHTAAGTAHSTTAGAATLGALNLNRVTWTDPTGAASVDIYRTASGGTPATLGLIANVLAGVQTYDDIGAVGDASTAPVASNGSGTGPEFAIDSWVDFTAFVNNFTGTWKLQVSPDARGSTPTNWYDAGTTATNSGFRTYTDRANWARIVILTDTGAVPVGQAIGLYADHGG